MYHTKELSMVKMILKNNKCAKRETVPFSGDGHSKAEEPELESSAQTQLCELGPNALPIRTLGFPH